MGISFSSSGSPRLPYIATNLLGAELNLAKSTYILYLVFKTVYDGCVPYNPSSLICIMKSIQEPETKTRTPKGKHRWNIGWRAGVIACAIFTSVAFVINLGVTVWVIARRGVGDGTQLLYQGSCAQTKRLSIWIRFAINVLSTILLGANNYTMQVLIDPLEKILTATTESASG
jgi:hypothetical protein